MLRIVFTSIANRTLVGECVGLACTGDMRNAELLGGKKQPPSL